MQAVHSIANTSFAVRTEKSRPLGSDILGLLVTLLPEAERVCILAGISANVANALGDATARVDPRSLIKFFPRESAFLILATTRLSRFYGNFPISCELKRFDQALAQAKQATIEFASDGFVFLADDKSARPGLVDAWRAACVAGLSLVRSLRQAIVAYEITGVADYSGSLSEMLEAAISGWHPLIDGSGEVAVPPWAEQRESRRLPVSCRAMLIRSGRKFPVRIRDISAAGLGIDEVTDVIEGDWVEIQINEGFMLEGTVIWASGSRAGIQLKDAIQTDDPRFKFCSRSGAVTSLSRFSN